MKFTGKDVAQILAIAVGAFAVYKIVSGVSSAVKSGGDLLSSTKETVKSIVTEDLNPTSDKNIVYSSLPESTQEYIGNTVGGLVDKFYGQNVATEGYPSYNKWVSNFWSGILGTKKDEYVGVDLSSAITNTEAAKRKSAQSKLGAITGVDTSNYVYVNE